MSELKRILLITTGGTIASVDMGNGLTPAIGPEELLSYIPDHHNVYYVNYVELFNLDSTDMVATNWVNITRCIDDNYEQYDGFVITHGTDTLSYTASILSNMITNAFKPIIITGSQYPINASVTDAKDNLIDALRCASSDSIQGVKVVFAHKVIDAHCSKKMHTKNTDAFESINYPLIATIEGENIIINKESLLNKEDLKTRPIFNYNIDTNIFVIKIVPGINTKLLDAVFANYNGIIIECLGIGGIPTYIKDELCKLIETCPQKRVCICSQITYDGTELGIYEVGTGFEKYPNVFCAKLDTLEECYAKMVSASL